MIKYYIRKFENGDVAYYTEREYNKKIVEEFEEFKNTNEDYALCEIADFDYIDEDLVEIIEFDNKGCETINDAIRELFKHDTSNILDANSAHNISREDLLENSSISYCILNSNDYYFNISFKITEINEDDIFESKIENVELEIL